MATSASFKIAVRYCCNILYPINEWVSPLRYVVEVVDDADEIRCFTGELIRRDGNRLVMRHLEMEYSFDLTCISDWIAVDSPENDHLASN